MKFEYNYSKASSWRSKLGPGVKPSKLEITITDINEFDARQIEWYIINFIANERKKQLAQEPT